MEIVNGNILFAKEEYIIQQCNCIGSKPKGLSQQIAENLGCNPYTKKHSPGTIEILEGSKKVICMFAQYYPGKPKQLDSFDARLEWFKQCLEKIALLNPKSLAVPYKIGCGLAGGNWLRYNQAIKDFSIKYPCIKICIYKL